MRRDFIEVCPKCKCMRIFVTNRENPKYRCHDCGYEFDDPSGLIVHKIQTQRKEIGKQYSHFGQYLIMCLFWFLYFFKIIIHLKLN